MTEELPLNRTTAKQTLLLFDICFKQGVFDAMYEEDDYAVKDFVDRHKSDGSYGLLYDEEDFDWKRWRFVIDRLAREHNLRSLSEQYLNSPYIRKNSKNFMLAVLPMTMRFYLFGMEEWLEYPDPVGKGTVIFKSTPRMHWKPMPKHMVIMNNVDLLSYLQEFIYERQKLKLEGDLTAKQYDSFSIAMYNLTRRYATITKY